MSAWGIGAAVALCIGLVWALTLVAEARPTRQANLFKVGLFYDRH